MKPSQQITTLGLKGRVKVSVLDHTGRTVCERPWQPNLLLDQGMNNLGDGVALANLFLFAAKGVSAGSFAPTKETVPGSNSFTLSGSVLTRSAGTRDFTSDDIGKLARQADSPNTECIITSVIGVTSVNVRAVGQTSLVNYTAKDIILYSVQQVGFSGTQDGSRSSAYGPDTDDNKTTDVSNVRTLRRTFIFDPEVESAEIVTGAYSRSGTTVTRDSGARDFIVEDEGKFIYFLTAGTLTKITAFTDAAHVTVADSGTIASQSIELYGFFSIGEVGFSNLPDDADNLNIRVRLEDGSGNSDPVPVDGSNPLTPGQQLKIVYELQITVTPNTSTAGTAAITDSGNNMSADKTGHFCVEQMALSRVDTDGATNLDFASLDPGIVNGFMALSPSSAAIVPLNGPDRSAGAAITTIAADAYVDDSFTRLYEGNFGLVDANATNWRSLGIYDVDSETFPFVFLFTSAQIKDSDHVLIVRWRKTWNRDLS